MKPMRPTHQLIKRMVPALAVWGIGRVLEIPAVKQRIEKIDDRFFQDRVLAKRSLRRAKTAVQKNRALLAAGATAVAVGIGLIAKATKR